MKTRKPNPLKSDDHLMYRGGYTSRCAEVRHGTKTFRLYMQAMSGGLKMAGGATAFIEAKDRQRATARRLFDANMHADNAKGRVVRAVLRSMWEDLGRSLDARFEG